MITVLSIEDEEPIRNMMRFAFSREGIDMLEATDVASARDCLAGRLPDLILLDWMLPDESGLNYLKSLRKEARTRNIPVIMLTARAEEEDKIRGLEHGADDFITKPFSPKEMIARVRAVVRRATGGDVEGKLMAGDLQLNPTSHQVSYNGVLINMGPTEFRLLQFLMSHQGRVYSRNQLLDNVWLSGGEVEERTVDVHVRRVRKALEPHGCSNLIRTVRGAGYRMDAEPLAE
jgi:two-component system phosphate regulon response regulator PhoB